MPENTDETKPTKPTREEGCNIGSYFLWLLTIAYLIGAWFLVFEDILTGDHEPNVIGDTLAGVFAPLAFLWLIAGYFQQQKELRQNTKALMYQYDELKQSVEAQKDLAEYSHQSLINESPLELYISENGVGDRGGQKLFWVKVKEKHNKDFIPARVSLNHRGKHLQAVTLLDQIHDEGWFRASFCIDFSYTLNSETEIITAARFWLEYRDTTGNKFKHESRLEFVVQPDGDASITKIVSIRDKARH